MVVPDVVIYHGNCDDGFGAAFAIWRCWPDAGIHFHAATYQETPPNMTDCDVAIVDFSYKRPVMCDIARQAASVLVLDHHKTAEADLAGLQDECPNVKVHFDMARSGAVMAWQYFHPDPDGLVPLFFQYLQDRDLWTKKLPHVDEFTAALRSYPQDFATWNSLDVNTLIDEGIAIQRYYRKLIEDHKKHAYRRNIGGHVVPVVNASLFMSSELAGELAEGEPFAAVYVESNGFVTWSLRSRENGLDVSEIAKQFGGGGHKHAAGFRIKITNIEGRQV